MKQSAEHVLRYFAQFVYPPTKKEVYTFLPKAIKKDRFNMYLNRQIKQNKIIARQIAGKNRYQLPEHRSAFRDTARKVGHGTDLFNSAKQGLSILRIVPWILYMGISGSLSMRYTRGTSDIDVFIITTPNTLWLSRFTVLVYKRLLIFMRPQIGKKLCFNLFFAENGLALPAVKHTEYIGHEILQLKTIIDKNHIYDRFAACNAWIQKLFPNVHINSSRQYAVNRISEKPYSSKFIESITKRIQTWWLDRKGYRYKESGNQLWLIQKDYERELS